MQIDIVTLFPNMFVGPFDESIIKRAEKNNLITIKTHQLRDYTEDKHKTVDDRPFGGGTGMLLKVEPVFRAVEDLKHRSSATTKSTRVILVDAAGEKFTQKKALELSKEAHLIFLSGHYEGFDHRVHEHIADEILSIGDFVMTGGELPTMMMVDAIVRLIPGVLPKDDATVHESFSLETNHPLPFQLLEYPQYTRPVEFNGWNVPEVVRSGNTAQIKDWQKEESLKITEKYRPDLVNKLPTK